MSLRPQVQTACQRCRKKRVKCNGQQPCESCDEAGQVCEYLYAQHVTKGELRAEIERLKRRSDESKELLKAIGSIKDPVACKMVLRGLMKGSQSRKDGLGKHGLGKHGLGKHGLGKHGLGKDTGLDTTSSHRPQREDACFNQPTSRTLKCHHYTPGGNPESLSMPLSLTSLPLVSKSHRDPWTRTGWTRAHMRHLFDSLITRDYLPFSFICQDLFLHDYHVESRRFCSPALVHAMLAVATRSINGKGDDARTLPDGCFGSRMFFDEAVAIIQDSGSPLGLPDIQALGMLALYELRREQEAKALGLAETFAESITELCQQEPLISHGEDYTRARATTYCGAISLIRILRLATGHLFNAPSFTVFEDSVVLDQPSHSSKEGSDSFEPNANLSQSRNFQLISIKMFQLTEWVYKLVISTRSTTGCCLSSAWAVYKKCLDWYESVFALLTADGSRTPFVLFIHMYYHFCLLCALRPFTSLRLHNSYAICVQAAQSVLTLAQSHDDLFTLQRVSELVPYFVCASGLFGLAVDDGGPRLHSVPGHGAQLMIKDECRDDETPFGCLDSPHVTMSTAAHARLLLAKMGSWHPVGVVTEGLLDSCLPN